MQINWSTVGSIQDLNNPLIPKTLNYMMKYLIKMEKRKKEKKIFHNSKISTGIKLMADSSGIRMEIRIRSITVAATTTMLRILWNHFQNRMEMFNHNKFHRISLQISGLFMNKTYRELLQGLQMKHAQYFESSLMLSQNCILDLDYFLNKKEAEEFFRDSVIVFAT